MWYKERGRYVTVGGGLRGEEGQFYLSDGVSVADRPYIPQPGDLICYDGHVAMYIGGGMIVHASSAKTGIKVSRAQYRTILSVRRIVQ